MADLRLPLGAFDEPPARLAIGGLSVAPVPLSLIDDVLDFAELAGRPQTPAEGSLARAEDSKTDADVSRMLQLGFGYARFIAAAFTTIDSDRERTVIIGAGADWHMAWWVNGELVYDTLARPDGNGDDADEPRHPIRLPLRSGKNVIAVQVVSGANGHSLVVGPPPAPPAIDDAGAFVDVALRRDPSARPFLGAGVQVSAYRHCATAEGADWPFVLSEHKWEMALRRIEFIRPGLSRLLMYAPYHYLVGLEPGRTPALDFTRPGMTPLYRMLDALQRIGSRVILSEFVAFDAADAYHPRWAGRVAEVLHHLVVEKGYGCIDSYEIENEPYLQNGRDLPNYERWKRGLLLLKTELDRRGLRVPLHTSYGAGGATDAEVRAASDRFDMHFYPYRPQMAGRRFERDVRRQVERVSAATGGRGRFVLGEVGFYDGRGAHGKPFTSRDSQLEIYGYDYGWRMADLFAQAFAAGGAGVVAWSCDDAMFGGIRGEEPSTHLKRWGMWNTVGTELCADPADENLRPWFYVWSLLSRHFPAGCVPLAVDHPPDHPVSVAAAVVSRAAMPDAASVLLVNPTDRARTVVLRAPALGAANRVAEFRYEPDGRPTDADGFPVPATTHDAIDFDGLAVTLAPRAARLYTNVSVPESATHASDESDTNDIR